MGAFSPGFFDSIPFGKGAYHLGRRQYSDQRIVARRHFDGLKRIVSVSESVSEEERERQDGQDSVNDMIARLSVDVFAHREENFKKWLVASREQVPVSAWDAVKAALPAWLQQGPLAPKYRIIETVLEEHTHLTIRPCPPLPTIARDENTLVLRWLMAEGALPQLDTDVRLSLDELAELRDLHETRFGTRPALIVLSRSAGFALASQAPVFRAFENGGGTNELWGMTISCWEELSRRDRLKLALRQETSRDILDPQLLIACTR